MGVLDDAIREHLELQRRHGVGEAELKRQEVEALGPARREPSPRPAAEESVSAPAEAPGVEIGAAGTDPATGALETEIPPAPLSEDEAFEEYGAEPLDAPGEDVTRISAGATLDDERILDEEELAEEELADELAGGEDAEEPAVPPLGASEPESPTEEHTTVFSPPPAAGPAEVGTSADALEEQELADEALLEEEPLADDRALDEEAALDEEELLEGEALADADEPLPAEGLAADEDEDVLEDTPDFLQETPEHERLWFEQKPPRDFDLDR